MNSINHLNHEGEFGRVWNNPSNTGIKLPPVDVNRVLAEHYRTSEPLTFTRTGHGGAEGMEARPLYPSVVREGSAHAWGRRSAADEIYIRSDLNIELTRCDISNFDLRGGR